jgi:hypothetical protein
MREIKLQRVSHKMIKSSFKSLELLKSYLSFFSAWLLGQPVFGMTHMNELEKNNEREESQNNIIRR